jgi:DNA-binding transcriptional MerR regulator
MADEPRYPIRAVVRFTGIPAATLRSWERRYGFPSPARNATSRRFYTGADLEAIRWLKAQAGLGLSIGQAVQWYRRGHAGGATPIESGRIEQMPDVPSAKVAGRDSDPASLVRQILGIATDYDERAIEDVLASAFGQYPPDSVLLEVMTPVLDEVGECWARGALPVTAEHFIANLFRRRLLNLLGQQPVLASAPSVVLACVAGEEHELGLLMLAVFLRWAGVQPLYLGASVPLADLLICLRQTGATVLCLSAVDSGSTLSLIEEITQIALAGLHLSIFAGGRAGERTTLAKSVQTLGPDLRESARIIAAAARTGGI